MSERTKRWRVLVRDGFTCRYCGRMAPDVVLEVDHVVPRSVGGSDDEDNLVTACYDCNQGKGAHNVSPVFDLTFELRAERIRADALWEIIQEMDRGLH